MGIKDFRGQNFKELKRLHCSSNLFVDPEFAPNIDSLAISEDGRARYDYYNIKWKRPSVILNKSLITVRNSSITF